MTINCDEKTVAGFADEWTRFDQSAVDETESAELFDSYFRLLNWEQLPDHAIGFDLGCGTGRWARHVAPRVGRLHCIDASHQVVEVARQNVRGVANCTFHAAPVDEMPLADASMDFGYSLGVLHHLPSTFQGIQSCVAKLKRGAPLLLYLYYSFDDRPKWFRLLWSVTDLLRRGIARSPRQVRYAFSELLAGAVYYPLARAARAAEGMGLDVSSFPLSFYRHRSFYTMRTDALDRFGTRLERRFSAKEIEDMMQRAGLERISFSPDPPHWCAIGYRAGTSHA